ncbi:hypothetical protein DFA_02440 [Cavenderia fasciculata]|uniref:Uncharacterized protein n=1 Tax=Cavenderia fasciculata TaxID=261658 RepID=F4PZG3_CACFS|nr:uncharacterized protein DFA_02440 [Cavenderia fasciculata]EGG19192.1 hypothetical protein DFA_02440 [Cavenderia fasciculata]|eukprot:XP_004366825.1 hypothetical protein DFA_02440 [Cavenderia fasciculata]
MIETTNVVHKGLILFGWFVNNQREESNTSNIIMKSNSRVYQLREIKLKMEDNSNLSDIDSYSSDSSSYSSDSSSEDEKKKKKKIKKKIGVNQIDLDSEYTKEELKGCLVSTLRQICNVRKIYCPSSIKKKDAINLITDNQEQKKKLKQLEVVTKQYHVGTVNYALPIYLIIKIFKYIWDELLDQSMVVDLSLPKLTDRRSRFRMALYLASINKQLFNVVSTFTSSFRITYKDLMHMTSVSWNVIKRPSTVSMDHHDFDNIFFTKNPSVRITETFSSVTKLKINYGGSGGIIRKTSFVQMGNILQGLVSFKAGKIKLENGHYQVLASLPTLVKIDIKEIYNPDSAGDLVKLLNHPVVKLIMPSKYDYGLDSNPIVKDSIVKFEAAFFKKEYKSLRNKRKLERDGWITLLSSFASLTILENRSKKNVKQNGDLDFEIAEKIKNPFFKYYIVRIQGLHTSNNIIESSTSQSTNTTTKPKKLTKKQIAEAAAQPLSLPPNQFQYLKEKWKGSAERKIWYIKLD